MATLDTHPYRVWMVQYAAFHGLAYEEGFDPSLHGSLGEPGRRFLLRIQKHMVASGKFPNVTTSGLLDGPTREALAPDRPSWQEEFKRIARQDDQLDGEEYYTQGSARWQGVTAVYGKVKKTTVIPKLRGGDCSAGYTRWVLWGLQQHLGRVPHDVVNGASWRAGYTGTIVVVCKHVSEPQIGDAILYGSSTSNTTHVTGVYDVGQRTCISHGRDRAEIYGWDAHSQRLPGFYRPDINKA